MLTIVFYGHDSAAAKRRGREIASDKTNKVRVYHSFVWRGQNDACDAVEVMQCVPKHHQDKISAVFGMKVKNTDAATEAVEPKRRGGWPKGKPRRRVE